MSCNASTSYLLAYNTTPTSYQEQIYNYTALYTGIATLEFGFKAKSASLAWHLDDVSILDTTASNIQMLVNGGFENNLTGWQVLCSSENCAGSGSFVFAGLTHSGTYCYKGSCFGAYDFLHQSFSIVTGHIYMLSFWLFTGGDPTEAGYVTIR
jgi:hypothetical protein